MYGLQMTYSVSAAIACFGEIQMIKQHHEHAMARLSKKPPPQ